MNQGFIKLHRKIFENEIWKNPVLLRLFLWIMGNAVFDSKGIAYGKVRVQRGQYLRSYRNLIKDLEFIENNKVKQFSLASIKRAVDKLCLFGIITVTETELGTLFTIVNYDKYQANQTKNEIFEVKENSEDDELETGLETKLKQPRNNNKNDKTEYKYSNDSKEFLLAKYLFELIRQRRPNFKEPDLQQWAYQVDLMVRIDKRNYNEIVSVIKWSQLDSFWKNNILSTDKLRKQFDNLALKMASTKTDYGTQNSSINRVKNNIPPEYKILV